MSSQESFANYLKVNLNAEKYNNLPALLGITKYRTTTLLNGNDDWKLEELKAIAKVLEMDCFDLILDFKLGEKYIKLGDINELMEERGLRMSLVSQ